MFVQRLVMGFLRGVAAGQLLLFPKVQSTLHPSPSTVLLSSHCYETVLVPSPQTSRTQIPLKEIYPGSHERQ